MESGLLLPAAEAKKVLEKRLQKTAKFSSPAKPAASTTPNNQLQISGREQGFFNDDDYCTCYSDLIGKEFNKSELEVASIMLNLSHPVVYERGATRLGTRILRHPWLRKSIQPRIFRVIDYKLMAKKKGFSIPVMKQAVSARQRIFRKARQRKIAILRYKRLKLLSCQKKILFLDSSS
ncbi:hypothetical protein Rs2_29270 [Raphanus sativus]|nr:hypothetical protein Rs2_29270 [Raphanus sativus]